MCAARGWAAWLIATLQCVFHFLSGLPEEQVGADRGAEHGHDHQQGCLVQLKMRPDDTQRDFAPVDVQAEHHGDIGEQRKRQPLEPEHIGAIRQEHLQHQTQQTKGHRIDLRRTPDQQPQRFGHGGDIG